MQMSYRRVFVLALFVALATAPTQAAVDNIFRASETTINLDDLLRVHGNLRYGLNYTNDFLETPAYTHHDFRTRLTLNILPKEKSKAWWSFKRGRFWDRAAASRRAPSIRALRYRRCTFRLTIVWAAISAAALGTCATR